MDELPDKRVEFTAGMDGLTDGMKAMVRAIAAFSADNDAGLITLASAIAEEKLTELIAARLLPPKKTRDDYLLRPDGAMGSFGAKVDFAYRLGVLDEESYRILSALRKLRNEVAQATEIVRLEEGAYKNKMEDLLAPNRSVYHKFINAFPGVVRSTGIKGEFEFMFSTLFSIMVNTAGADIEIESLIEIEAWDDWRNQSFEGEGIHRMGRIDPN